MLIHLLFNGLVIGSIYTLTSLGFVFAYRSTGAFNFFHGELYMLGAFLGFLLNSVFQLPLAICLLLAIFVTGLAGVVVERIAIRSLILAPHYHVIIATAALGLVIRNGVLLFTKGEAKLFPQYLPVKELSFLGMHFGPQKLLVILVTICLVSLLALFFRKTKMGKAMRAIVSNMKAASLMGINASYMQMLTFGLASVLGAIAGVLAAPLFIVDAYMGLFMTFKIFCVAVLGGLNSTAGPIVAGYLLGIAENLIGGYISTDYQDIFSFGIVICLLFVRPTGILGKRVSQKV
jgi:branched-chain amino acid transport system permease protein